MFPSSKPGVPETVAVRGLGPGESVVNVRSAGMPDWVMVSVWEASASVAVAWIGFIGVPSSAVANPGAVICGVGPAGPEETPSKSNQSPGVALPAPQGSEGSPATYVFAKE